MRKVVALVVLIALVAGAACTPTEVAAVACGSRAEVELLDGYLSSYRATSDFPAGGAVNAAGAVVVSDLDYPFYVTQFAGPDACIVGGVVTSLLPHATTPWAVWHDQTGFVTTSPGTDVILMRLANVGDGFRFGSGDSSDWSLRGVQVTRAHDDCVENDRMHGGLIDDSYFDGCFVFYSARDARGSTLDGSANTVTITDSLVRMEPMPHVYLPEVNTGPGHGPIWKLGDGASGGSHQGISPRFEIRDTIFRIDQDALHGSLGIPTYDHDGDPATPPVSYLDPADCSNNVIVWLGGGAMPGGETYPASCFTIVTDEGIWDAAVTAWEEEHDYSDVGG